MSPAAPVILEEGVRPTKDLAARLCRHAIADVTKKPLKPPFRLRGRRFRALFLHLCQCLLEVGDDVGNILDTYGEADEIRLNACGDELFIGHLTVSGGSGMQ